MMQLLYRRRGFALFTVLIVLLVGCAMRFRSELNPALPERLDVAKMTVPIGVYYGPDLRGYEYVRRAEQHRFIVPIGPASVMLIHRAVPLVFENVKMVDALPPNLPAEVKVNAVLEPRIDDADVEFSLPFGMDHRAMVRYRFTLYALDGTPFASWTVSGVGHHRSAWGTRSDAIGRATDLAMQDAIRGFATGFSSVPDVQSWLRRIGMQGAPGGPIR